MRASEFEFRIRFWLIGGIIWLSFFFYAVDHVNAASAIAGWIGARVHRSEDVITRVLLGVGALLAIAAAGLRTWATSYLRSEVVHDASVHSERLVADGPYRYVRNPLYLGTTLLTLGMGLLASRTGYVVMVIGVLLFDLRLIGREEAELTGSQGQSYRDYLKSVPCLIPSLVPKTGSAGGHPHWKQAFEGEGFFWGFAAATVAFAVTLKLLYFWITLALAFALYGWVQVKLKRQKQSSGSV